VSTVPYDPEPDVAVIREDENEDPRYAERFRVVSSPIPARHGEGARLKFAPPKNKIIY